MWVFFCLFFQKFCKFNFTYTFAFMNYYKFSNVTQGVKVQKTTQILGNICLTIEPDNITVRIINEAPKVDVKPHRKGVEL